MGKYIYEEDLSGIGERALSLALWGFPMYKKALKEIKKAEDPGDGRLCCELYKKLPPRREFKDYYEVIDNPIDLQVWVEDYGTKLSCGNAISEMDT